MNTAHECSEGIGPMFRNTETSRHLPALNWSRLISSAEDSPVRTSAMPDTEPVLRGEAVPDYGGNSPESFAWWDRSSYLWRTYQHCLFGDLEKFWEPWPISGSMRNGVVFQHAPWVRHTCDSECSSWPTPTASSDTRGFGVPLHERSGRYRQSITLKVQELVREHGWRIHPNFTEALMPFPGDWSVTGDSETP